MDENPGKLKFIGDPSHLYTIFIGGKPGKIKVKIYLLPILNSCVVGVRDGNRDLLFMITAAPLGFEFIFTFTVFAFIVSVKDKKIKKNKNRILYILLIILKILFKLFIII